MAAQPDAPWGKAVSHGLPRMTTAWKARETCANLGPSSHPVTPQPLSPRPNFNLSSEGILSVLLSTAFYLALALFIRYLLNE